MVALRGDPRPAADVPRRYRPHPGGFPYASDLVAGLARRRRPSRSRWPPTRKGIRSPARVEADLENLKRKIDAGAIRAITQFFFDTDVFLRFRDRCAAAASGRPSCPAFFPITRFPQVLRFAERCGASIPQWLRERFDGLDDDAETRRMIAAQRRDRAGAATARARRRRVSFLYPESCRAHLRDLPCARAAPAAAPARRLLSTAESRPRVPRSAARERGSLQARSQRAAG